MSLADIVRKIEHDASDEATEIVRAAEQDARSMREDAEKRSEQLHEETLARARATADENARMRVAAARLSGRDRLLAEKRVMVERVLTAAVERLEALPDAEYATLLAHRVAESARGGETLALGEKDADRLHAHLPAALREAGCDVSIGESTSSIARGVLLEGDRMRVEISVAAFVEARHEECEATVVETLFGGEDG
jgi:vacuolar-type H+-ATPase subunit E/Vma4